MKFAQRFKFAILLILVPLLAVEFLELCADAMRSPSRNLFQSDRIIPSKNEIESARRLVAIAPQRTDLKADLAQSLAIPALASDAGYRPDVNQDAQAAARQALEAGPHDSRIWLTLALLTMQRSIQDAHAAGFLKMSYLTGASSVELVPTRIAAISRLQKFDDTDLQELARGDIRLILNRFPEMKPALANAYRTASAEVRAFVEQSSAAIDPKFASSLRNQQR